MACTSLVRRLIDMPRAYCAGVAICALSLAAVGCQPTSRSTVAHLPPPSFAGPDVTPASPAPAPVAVRAAPRVYTGAAGPTAWALHVPARPWRWIVIHHSATPAGSAAVFDKMHKAKGWDELGYHFVIGNGTDSGNGQVEVGPRWPKQKWGAHAKTADNKFNEYGIGICLVGNFDLERPTPQQLASLNKLVCYLMRTYHVPADRVLGHGETKATDCPGKYVNIAQIRRTAMQTLASAGELADLGSNVAEADTTSAAVAASAVQSELVK